MTNVFTAEALRAMGRTQDLQRRIQELIEVERDLEWVWYESPTELRAAVETALAALRTTTRTFHQALGQAERTHQAGG